MVEIQDAINSIKAQFDGVNNAMEAAKTQLQKTKDEHRKWELHLAEIKGEHGKLLGEINARQVAADRASEEAARRIQLATTQVAESLRVQEDVKAQEKELAKREKAVEAASREVNRLAADVGRREAAVMEKEAEIKRRFDKFREAVS